MKNRPLLLPVSLALLFSTHAMADTEADPTTPPLSDTEWRAEVQALQERLRALESAAATRQPAPAGGGGTTPRVRLGDGMILEDGEGNWSLRATARAMADYRSYAESADKADTFSIRRARIGLGFTVREQFTGYLETDLAFGLATQSGTPSTAGLLQGFLEYSPSPAARLRVGQFKPSFTLEATTGPFHVDFQERSLAFNLLQNFLYDRGAMLHGSPARGVVYAFSVTNGTGINVDEFQRNAPEGSASGKDITVRALANAAAWMDLPDTVIHFGGSYKTGHVANGDASTAGYSAASGLTEGRGLVFFNPVPFNTGAPGAANRIDRSIAGIETAFAYRQFKVQAELMRARYAGTLPGGPAFERHIDAGYVSASWLITGESFANAYTGGVFTRIAPASNYAPGSGRYGALQLSARYSFFDGSDFDTANPANTGVLGGNTLAPAVTVSTKRADAWTLALKWMPTPHVAYMVNYVLTQFDTPVTANGVSLDREHALTMRAQFDFF